MSITLPKVTYKSDSESDIEVMTFGETYKKLTKTTEHNPFAVHKIQFYLILIVTENVYSHYVDFKFYDLKKGSVLFVAKNQVQYFTEDFKNVKGFCIVLNSQFLEQNYFLSKNNNLNRLYNYHLENPVIHSEEMGNDEFIGVVEKLYFEYMLPNNFAKADILRAYIDIILLKAERVKQQHAIVGVKTQWLEVFNEFKNMLESNYAKTRSSRDYSSKLLISYKFLNDIVKKSTGKTVKAFIDDFVIIEIKRYLVTTSLSVKEISYKTGFEEPANMTKFFKKNTQQTPLKFRQKL
ncbi:helix-turn-helix domain-containing protein [Zobellia nedashkovskayae]|uniref:helix-turn-helix domain-containing protein n=1 Tax=Zobellia nedashkovskayae TaxID=2779510 RepID=UPI00188DBCCA|nr:helix-turn-helix domain-containing protein [Zobellia nedashkovskayae]